MRAARIEGLDIERPKQSSYTAFLQKWCAQNAGKRGMMAAKAGDTLEISMLDVIGYDYWSGGGITAESVKAQLEQYPDAKTIKILTNSPGGDAFEGLAIQNLLKRTGCTIAVEVIGVCASAMSVIAMAGDTIAMHEGTLFMVHEAVSCEYGSGDDMRCCAGFLDAIDSTALDVYARRTGRDRAELAKMIKAETWMTAPEAVTQKFATSVIVGKGEKSPPAPAKQIAVPGSAPRPASPTPEQSSHRAQLRRIERARELREQAPAALKNAFNRR